MTLDKLKKVIEEIRATALQAFDYGVGPVVRAQRMDTTKKLSEQTPYVIACHLVYMCDQMQVFIEEGRIEKCMRWLGFAQGVCFMMDWATVQDLERMNKPDPT